MEFSRSKKINNLFFHASTGKDDDSFVGIKIKGNDILFFYPESYHLEENEEDIKNDIVDLIKTISIAKTQSKEESKAYDKSVGESDFALRSYLWVINDYLKNGYYINREKTYKKNQNGKVNWKKTFDNQPIISNGNIIYNEIIIEAKNSVDNIIVEIHKYCLKLSIDRIGRLFGLNSNAIYVKPCTVEKKKMYLTLLKKELSYTFEDDKKIRLTHFCNVIQGLDTTFEGKDFVYGVDKYYYVFERMIDCIFGNVQDISDFYPSGKWHLIKTNQDIKSSDLRPDTVLINERSIYILDSKFYRFGFTGDPSDLPETSSIQKQITYGDFVLSNKKDDYDNIYNAFLIPYDKTRDVFKSDNNMQYIGYAKTNSNDGTYVHETVHAFLIDLKHVVKTYNNKYHSDEINYLISEISKNNIEVIVND